ncbi:BTB/POZ domain-containing protein At3g19850-like [Curcuma longa]|uniref:BTB/POZ domain-containing protein At3g19850-like n=1 Tax=Curcuma longa TaxID=136217 RepID=UPI003D9EA783
MHELCDLEVHIDGRHVFFLHQKVLCAFSGKLKRMVLMQEKRRSPAKDLGLRIMEFPGGPRGFELVSCFCYNNGSIDINPSNVGLLHSSAILLEMTEEMVDGNLVRQTEAFLDGLFDCAWNDIITALKSCELFFHAADSCGLLQRLISTLLAKIASNSENTLISSVSFPSSSSSPSSPDTSGFNWDWWFDGLTVLAPGTVEKIMKALGAYGSDNKNLLLTRFLLHYLKTAAQKPCCREQHSGLADTAVHGVVEVGTAAFSCRGLFKVMRVVKGLGLSRECKGKLERVTGLVLDQATLDDLLVTGHGGNGVYDVNLALRLVRTFVNSEEGGSSSQRMKKVGRLIDKYIVEISPDHNLKISKFLEVAECLPDSARDCFDGVYKAVDIFLESHPTLTVEERTRLCGCLNYEKLTLEACKELAKSRRVPPMVAVQALASQQHKVEEKWSSICKLRSVASSESEEEEEEQQLRLSFQRMLVEVCRNMKGRSGISHGSKGLPRLC